MIPDLGKYAVTVLSAYGVSLLLLAVICGASIWRARRVKAALRVVEERIKNGR
ncbi:heme exporter protein CcmD [Pseudooceanicola algae]|uniref:Heme exporter protein D n=1 Tax=Pseudooceanicola algae TaxID=1537215 RepID=A0A418SC36_9RHOB|nr:heme exporter protein CcmD [Pseudooceanicola algae]QPM89966.1 hypothetical protein PSAL_011970 [Pseudooceanicola algae]